MFIKLLNIKFISPEYFLLLIPIGLLIIYFYVKNKNELQFFYMKDLREVYKGDSFFYKLKYFLISIIFINFVIILANPVSENNIEKIKKNWIDIEIVLDVSYSMVANDLKPSRLEVAKDVIVHFLDKLDTDRVWIIVFSWKPFTSLPLTFDYNILKESIKNIKVWIIDQNRLDFVWTALGDALVLWKLAFNDDNEREKVIILLTDWEANKWLSPVLALKLLKEEGIRVYTIWIWWKDKTTILMPTPFWYQNIEVWWIDEAILKKIATETSWKYFKADNEQTFNKIFDEISLLEKSEIEMELIKTLESENKTFLYFLILSMMFLMVLIYKKG